MAESRIFRLTGGEGYGAVVNGNFIEVRVGMRGVYASVFAFLSDDNLQHSEFDNATDAVAWAVAAAKTHEGQPRERFPIAHWEIRHGYSATVRLIDSGEYEGEIFPLWVNSRPEPIRIYKRFPTQDEAVQWAREAADEQSVHDNDYELSLRQIRDSLEAQTGLRHPSGEIEKRA